MLSARPSSVSSGLGTCGRFFLAALAAFAALPLALLPADANGATSAKPIPVKANALRELNFSAPRTRLITGDRVRVVVNTQRDLRSFRARARGRLVTRRFHRVRPGRWAATLPVGRVLRAGINHVTVATRDRAGGKGVGDLRLIVGRRGKAAGSIRVIRQRSRVLARLRLAAVPELLTVTLNGRGITRLFDRHARGRQTEAIAPDDGLRFGRNTLNLTVALKNGRYARRTVRFRVARRHPLASAGRDRRARAGDTIVFDGRRSMSSSDGLGLRWRIKRAPKGSKARLRNASGPRPRLRADVNGTYQVELSARTLRAPGARGSDVATATVTPDYAPIGASVDTAVEQPGGGYAVQIGANCNANQQNGDAITSPYGAQPVQLIFLARDTLEIQQTMHLSGSQGDAGVALLAVEQQAGTSGHPNSIGVLTALPGTAVSPGYRDAIQVLTGTLPNLGANGGWSAIGVPIANFDDPAVDITGVVNAGDTQIPGNVLGEQQGFLQFDATDDDYTYVPGRYASYDTMATGSTATQNVVRVGAATYGSSALTAGCTGGYQLVTLRAASLTEPAAVPANQTFSSNCDNEGFSLLGVAQLGNALNTITGQSQTGADGPLLVFLQSIGDPIAASEAVLGQAAQVSAFIEQLGGTAETFNRSAAAANSGYALAGGTALAADAPPGMANFTFGQEATSLQSGSGTSLDGALKNSRLWHYQPVSGVSNFEQSGFLSDVVYQPPTAWPTGATPGEQNALAYISTTYDIEYSPSSSCYKPAKPDVRFEYCDLDASWGDLLRGLPKLAYSSSACGCSSAEWTAVKNDILQEVPWVRRVYAYIGRMQSVYGGPSGGATLLGLQQIGTDVSDAVNPPPGSGVAGYWTGLTGDVLNGLSLFPESSEAQSIITGLSALGYLAADLLSTPSGTPTLGQIVATDASELPAQTADRYQAASEQLGHFGDVIVTDYGKLQAAGTSPSTQIDETALTQAQGQMMVGAYRFAYQRLLGVAYNSYALMPNQRTPNATAPAQFGCQESIGNDFSTQYPFSSAAAGGWFSLSRNNPPLPIYGNGSPWMLALGEKGDTDADSVTTPPGSIVGPLTQPIVFSGTGVPQSFGEYPVWLFRQNFKQVVFPCS